jgi:hypothetical protein
MRSRPRKKYLTPGYQHCVVETLPKDEQTQRKKISDTVEKIRQPFSRRNGCGKKRRMLFLAHRGTPGDIMHFAESLREALSLQCRR